MPKGLRQYSAIKRLLEKYNFWLTAEQHEEFIKELASILEI